MLLTHDCAEILLACPVKPPILTAFPVTLIVPLTLQFSILRYLEYPAKAPTQIFLLLSTLPVIFTLDSVKFFTVP